jgi:alkaline phosphatase D
MKNTIIVISLLILISCQTTKIKNNTDFKLVFGSCTDAYKDSLQMWHLMSSEKPDLVLILGDIVYTKNNDIEKLSAAFIKQKEHLEYKKLVQNTPIEAIYDDNDYGQSDGGKSNIHKLSSKKMVLDFLETNKNDSRHTREGLYFSKNLNLETLLITLDTRTFRDDLTISNEKGKKYQPNTYGSGSMLGDQQWDWFEKLLENNNSKYIVLASTIQVINDAHNYEKWGNMPHERDKLFKLITKHSDKKFIILSGDRHFSEVSEIKLPQLNYTLYDLTSSGITQKYSSNIPEINPNRESPFINDYNFASLSFNNNKFFIKFINQKGKIIYEKILII